VGPLGEIGDSWLGRSESGYVATRHLQACSPRLCQLRTVRLAPVCKYWTYRSHADDMDPINLIVSHRQELGLRPCFISWFGREAGYGPVDRSVGVLWIVSGALFLGSSEICPNLSAPRERLSHTRTAYRKHMPDVRELAWEAYASCWSGFPLQVVHRFESPRLSDMSNRLFVVVFT
jgi:hypothetical protein